MKVEILPEARDDLIEGFRFYERQRHSLGSYFAIHFWKMWTRSWLTAAFTPKHLDTTQFEQALPFCDLLSCRAKCGSCPRDSRLPEKSFLDPATTWRSVAPQPNAKRTRAGFFGRIGNLTNEHYSAVFGFSALGRAAYGGVKVQF